MSGGSGESKRLRWASGFAVLCRLFWGRFEATRRFKQCSDRTGQTGSRIADPLARASEEMSGEEISGEETSREEMSGEESQVSRRRSWSERMGLAERMSSVV